MDGDVDRIQPASRVTIDGNGTRIKSRCAAHYIHRVVILERSGVRRREAAIRMREPQGMSDLMNNQPRHSRASSYNSLRLLKLPHRDTDIIFDILYNQNPVVGRCRDTLCCHCF